MNQDESGPDMEPSMEAGMQEATGRAETIYHVMYRGQLIGSSHLEGRDAGMAVAFGTFEPLPAYEAVRPIFQLFTEALGAGAQGAHAVDEVKLAKYSQARDALHLTLQTAEGRVVPTSAIHIVDWGDLGREVEVHISDATFWQEHHLG
jgi:hypothetical protein